MARSPGNMKLPTAILAGGKSTRMGQNKALLPLGSTTVIERIIQAVRPLSDPLFIVADFDREYQFLGLPIYPDVHKNAGPLAGIHSALTHADADRVLILSCDLPLITSEALMHLITHSRDSDAVVLSDGNLIHPLCGIYRRNCIPVADGALNRVERSVQSFLKTISTHIVDVSVLPDISSIVLTNLNTPEDYKSCLELIDKD